MKVILLQNVTRLGNKGDIVEVSEGYARNFLIKQRKAKEASVSDIKQLDNQRVINQKKAIALSEKRHKWLSSTEGSGIKIIKPANHQGHLFEKVDLKKVQVLLRAKSGMDFDKVSLNASNIKEVGNYIIHVKLDDKTYNIPFEISAK